MKASPNRGNGLSRSTQKFVSMSKSRVTGGWLSHPVIPRLLQWSSKESIHEVIAWVWRSVRHGNAIEQYSLALSVLIRNLEASCLLLHVLVACTLVELHPAFRRRKPHRWACQVAKVTQCRVVSSHSRSGHISCCVLARYMFGLGPPEGGIV